ncbi:hypothetical protein NKY45_29540 [Sinorhizobium meliloti]|uniref:hypothetical protein n=1 Tax=Rhizobium meliloti TaxID=382 RepID=UPI003D649798
MSSIVTMLASGHPVERRRLGRNAGAGSASTVNGKETPSARQRVPDLLERRSTNVANSIKSTTRKSDRPVPWQWLHSCEIQAAGKIAILLAADRS